jgi:hypothetical protein
LELQKILRRLPMDKPIESKALPQVTAETSDGIENVVNELLDFNFETIEIEKEEQEDLEAGCLSCS